MDTLPPFYALFPAFAKDRQTQINVPLLRFSLVIEKRSKVVKRPWP